MTNNRFKGWRKLLFGIFLLSLVFIVSCNKDEDVYSVPEEIRTINAFIWDNMDTYYLWREFMPANIDPNKEPDPKAYFEKLLYRPDDRWSFITDDYQSLIDNLNGIHTTFGLHFQLFKMPESEDIVGIVQYVTHNSPARQADIKRGDLFYKIDGTTLNTTNYQQLLYNRASFTIAFGNLVDGNVEDANREINLTAIKLQENPVLEKKVLDISGQKIGYMVYNQFISDFKDSLVAAFNTFHSAGVTNLVLDMRYNPGGAITNALELSSMIAPQSVVTSKSVFVKFIWNDILTDYILDEEGSDSDKLILKFDTPEINLDLSHLYVLVSSNTASASELIINGLSPYMDITIIGPENTHGKYTGSITLSDLSKHSWAIQPIVIKTANANGITDYRNGFTPDYIVKDDLSHLLGDPQEDMLAKAIELITGITTITRISTPYKAEFKGISIESGSDKPITENQRMIWDFPLPQHENK